MNINGKATRVTFHIYFLINAELIAELIKKNFLSFLYLLTQRNCNTQKNYLDKKIKKYVMKSEIESHESMEAT